MAGFGSAAPATSRPAIRPKLRLGPPLEKLGRAPGAPARFVLVQLACIPAAAHAASKGVSESHRDLSDVLAGVRLLARQVAVGSRRSVLELADEPEQVRARIEVIGDTRRDLTALESAGTAGGTSAQGAGTGARLDVAKGRAPGVGPAVLHEQHVRGVFVFLELPGGSVGLTVLLGGDVGLERVDANLVHNLHLVGGVLRADRWIFRISQGAACNRLNCRSRSGADSNTRSFKLVRAPEEVEVGLLHKAEIQGPFLPLDRPRRHPRKAFRARRNLVFAGIADRILRRALQPAEDRRRGKVDGVGAPQVEARRRTGPKARLVLHVGRR